MTRTSGSGPRRTSRCSRTCGPRTRTPRPRRRTWRVCGRASSTRSRAARSRPTCRCRRAAATGGTTAAPSRASSTASSAAPRSPRPTTGRRRSSSRASTCPASRCCSTGTSRPRATSSSRSAASTSPRTARGCCSAWMSPATSATRSGCATSSPASSSPTRSPAPSRARSSRPTAPASSTRPSTTPGGPTPSGCTPSAPTSRRTSTLFHEPDEKYWLGAGITRSDKYLVISVGSSITSEARILDTADLTAEPRLVWPRTEGVEYSVDHAVVDGEDVLLIVHNDGALDFELVQVVGRGPAGRAPRAAPPHHRAASAGCRLLPRLRRRGVPPRRARARRAARLRARRGRRAALRRAALHRGHRRQPGVGSPADPARLRLVRHARAPSTTTSSSTRELLLRKRQPVLGGYDPEDYDQARVWATAQDGTQLPISLVWKRSFGDAGAVPAAAAHVRLRLVRALDRAAVLDRPPLGARPRRRLRRRARARRRRDGPAVVRGRQAAAEAQHLHRLRRLRAAPDRQRVHLARPARRRGRQRRRPADGRRGQHRAGAVRRHPGRRAVRRRADDDPRPVAAADRHRVGRVGRPAARRRPCTRT